MRVLYKDFSDGYLSVAEVTGTTYYEEEQVLEFIGSDRDFAIQADEKTGRKARPRPLRKRPPRCHRLRARQTLISCLRKTARTSRRKTKISTMKIC